VQTLDHSPNTISPAVAASLSRLVNRRDPGRIYVAVVPVLTQNQAGQLAQDLANVINRDGVYIVVGGYNYHVTTTWGSGRQAENILGRSTGHQGDSLHVQLRKTINAFAAADAKAGHPGASTPAPSKKKQGASVSAPGSSHTTGTASTPISSQGAPVSIQRAPHKSGSSNLGLIVLLAALGLLLLAALIWGGLAMRTGMRVQHRRRERSDDIHSAAHDDLANLGEQIEALDIDSQMPNATAEAKNEYAKAIECYEEAEKRLKEEKDEYQFERAQDEIRKGLLHIGAANQLFNPSAEKTAEAAGLGSTESAPAIAGATASAAATPTLSPAPAPITTDDSDSTVSELAKLARLHERGILTDAEFAEEKRKLIGE
jgi:hypothetical protein